MEEIFEAIREACTPAVWSRGVELVRAEAVSGERADEDEAVLRVATRGGLVAPSVTLHLDDTEWECTCAGRDDPCEHVAAAAIALRRARQQGHALPRAVRSAGRLRYRLASAPGDGIELCREIVSGDLVHPLNTTLDALASGRVEGPGFAATAGDLAVERVLGPRLGGGVVAREIWPRLVDALAACEDVQLDGRPIRASAERVRPLAVVEDAPGGFRVSVTVDPSITRTFAGGVVLCGDVLRVAGESGLTGRETAELPEGRFYSADQAAELVSEVIPSLESRLPVEIRTRRLPRPDDALRPRLVVKLERDGPALSVLPLLVYGDPPCARVDAGRLVPLRDRLPVRDEAAEARLVAQLQRELGLTPGRRVTFEGEAAIALAERLAGSSMGGSLGVEGDAHRAFFRAPALEPRLRVDGDRFDLAFESPGAEATPDRSRRVPAGTVLQAWRAGDSLVPLSGGGLAPLPVDWLKRFGDRVADLLAARGRDGRIPACVLPDLATLCDDHGLERPPGIAALAPLLEAGAPMAGAPLPDDLTAELRPYQRHGVDWLCFLRDAGLGALLADDMGLGKTLQALCAVRGRVLVVTPTSVLSNWADEAARFRPSLRVRLYHGTGRILDADADLTLTSYALLRLDLDALSAVEWDAVILDEAQAIKNPESQAAQAAFALRARWRLALTGTPVENRLEELWSQIHFLNPGLLGGRADFLERSARPIAAGDVAAAERLRTRLRPFLLRRLKRDVARELPPRTDVVLRCALDEEERRVYDAVHAAARRDVVEKLAAGGSVLAALEALLRLRQASCHAGLVPGQQASSSSKVELLLERLEQAVADGHKALVFSQWTGLLDRVEPHLRERGLAFARLDGSTRDRGAVVGAFQSDGGAPILLVSLRAGGTGLNLTAADHVFLLDPWWNPAVEDQAADRTHRIGQSRPVFVYRLVARETVEERILELQARKRELARAAVEEADPEARLSREDLLALLE